MTWWSSIPIILVAIALTYLPGLIVAYAAGARRLLLYAAAPAVSLAMIGTFGILFSFLGIPWSAAAVVASSILVAVIAAVLHRLITGQWQGLRSSLAGSVPREGRWITAALALAAVIIAVQMVVIIGRPDHVSQTFDVSFHLNGVKYILDTKDASSFNLSGLILPPGRSSFYPAAWHDAVSLIAAASGGDIVAAGNMFNLVAAALVWPSGVLVLVRMLLPGSRSALFAAGVLSAAIPGFPILPLDYGVLFPYFLALVFVPLALALALSFTGLLHFPGTVSWPHRALALLAVIGVIGLSQPSVIFACAALLVPPLFAATVMKLKEPLGTPWRVLVIGKFVVFVLVLGLSWFLVGKLGNTSPWDAYATPLGALYELVTNSRRGTPVVIAASALVLIGLVFVIRRRQWWIAASWAIAASLFVLGAALPYGDLRNVAIGLFYKDTPRLTALLATIAVPLSALGAAAVWRVLRPRFDRVAGSVNRPVGIRVSAIAALMLLMAVTQGPAMQSAVHSASTKYDLTPTAPMLSPDERKLLSKLDGLIPEDAVVVGNPWTGSALAYVIGNRHVLNPHFNVSSVPSHVLINMHLNDALENPKVCKALDKTDVEYVLDFGIYFRDAGGQLDFDSTDNYKGLLDLEDSDIVSEVARVGDKVLYKITACE